MTREKAGCRTNIRRLDSVLQMRVGLSTSRSGQTPGPADVCAHKDSPRQCVWVGRRFVEAARTSLDASLLMCHNILELAPQPEDGPGTRTWTVSKTSSSYRRFDSHTQT
jgi:hypothetical protein